MEDGCSRKSAGAASGLPDDLLVDILSRVPAKSICRFKCVSKAWRDLIDDPDHRKKLRQAMQGLFVQMCHEISDPEVDNPKYSTSFRFIDLTLRSVALDMDDCFPFMTEMARKDIFFLDSCKGLLLLGHRRMQTHGTDVYILCDPTTRQWSAVPVGGSPEDLNQTYLSFDPAVSSHFRLVEFQMPDLDEYLVSLHVYSSKTGTWSQNRINEQNQQGDLEGWHCQYTLDPMENQFAFVNGFLHLVVWRSQIQHILAVDVQGKARRIITVPGMTNGRHEHALVFYLGQSQGHLYCLTRESENEKLSTWVLQDYDTQEWVLKNTVCTSDVFGETQEMPKFRVVDIHQDCNVVFFFDDQSCELIAYNMDRKEASVIATFEHRKFESDFARYIPYFSESPVLTNKY